MLVTAIVAGGFGCELLAQIDRSQISGTTGSGGNGGGGASATSTASSTSSGGGLGGAGGTGGTGGTGGVGGGMPCDVATDCPDPKNECLDRTCIANKCGQAPRPVGTLGATQTGGDCQKSQCDGAGKLGNVADDADVPVDAFDCTDDVCTAGVASNPAKPASSACGQGGLLFCNGAGQCVGCIAPTDCAGTDTECQTRTCTTGACGVMNAPQGTVVNAQMAGNCKKDQCDGGGAVETVPDSTDLPVDSQTCTKDVCTGGVASNPPVAVGVACSEGSGILCDGAGKCAACLIATDCAGVDTECQQRSCTAGVCGVTFTSLGTALTTQTASNCMKAVCDGAGGITAQNDDTDLPDDNNVCTSDVCTSGVPSHANAANGASCGGTLACLNGVCAGCGQPSDCPGVNDECKARSCTVGVCGFAFTANGTAVAAQTAGDCQKKQCDGAGNIASATDNTDVPADDGTQCTGEICTAGAPSHPAVAANTACNQGGGTFCSAVGTCVQCNAATQCSGTDTECHTRTCVANSCGATNAAAGTVTTTQATGDCKKNQCDGAGNIVNSVDNADLPVDDGNQCAGEICTAGVPSHPAAAVNTACNQGGGSFCSAGGSCVQCNAAAQCAGTDTECRTRTCVAGACGLSFMPSGTATSSQASGDCQKNQCDGAGNIVGGADNTDLPADDGNACTSDTCLAGVPSHPAQANGTICNDGNGCTQTDTCQAGTCTGASPVACAALDQCHTVGTCNAGTGLCSNPSKADGSACSDGNGCTQSDTCQAGTCTGANPVTCAALDACHVVGTCNAGTGVCSNPAAPDGTSCADGNACTTGDTCEAGACAGSTTLYAQLSGAQEVGAGDPDGIGTATITLTATQVCWNITYSNLATPTGFHIHGPAGVGQNAPVLIGFTTPASSPASGCVTPSAAAIAAVRQAPANHYLNLHTTEFGGGAIRGQLTATLPCPASDQCHTAGTCDTGTGVCSNPTQPINTACNQGGGSFCSAVGTCVQCNAATQCAGTDTECRTRTCSANVCGANDVSFGTPTSAQSPNDCKLNVCDGTGNIIAAPDGTDLPADDGSQCTGEICTLGVPSHPNAPINTACNQGGGSVCNAGGSCVQCNLATQCAGADTECQTRTCSSNVCGVNNTAVGTPTSAQTSADCKKNQCDGAGNIGSSADNTDVPTDGNQCTGDVCTAGVPSNPSSPAGTACNQSGGTVCDGAGTCAAIPQVASTSPSDATLPVAAPPVAVTFTIAMNPATLTGQTTAGACSGSIQVSLDNFASCVAFSSAAATMSGGNTTATFTTAPGLLVNRIYKIRVTTAAASATGNALAAQFTTATGFTTTTPNLCNGSLVMSQVYGGGGNAGAQYTHDFVELHNRGTTTLSLAGLSLQYTSSAGTIWNGGGSGVALLSGSIPAGGYFLVRLATGGAVGAALPTPDLTPAAALPLSATNGKIALINGTAQIANGACPPAATTVDFVGYGSADCKEGALVVPVLSNTTAALRAQSGCADVNNNGADFSVVAPLPRNGVSAAVPCTCAVENESNSALEADYCAVQFPLSLSVAAGASTGLIFGRIFETGTTEAAGANGNVRAQLGYGLPTVNPEYEAGWTWTNATFNIQSGNNDEYQASFTAPASGSYRYVYRFSNNQGVSWTVCDQNAGDGGAGSNAGLLFAFADEPVLTVP